MHNKSSHQKIKIGPLLSTIVIYTSVVSKSYFINNVVVCFILFIFLMLSLHYNTDLHTKISSKIKTQCTIYIYVKAIAMCHLIYTIYTICTICFNPFRRFHAKIRQHSVISGDILLSVFILSTVTVLILSTAPINCYYQLCYYQLDVCYISAVNTASSEITCSKYLERPHSRGDHVGPSYSAIMPTMEKKQLLVIEPQNELTFAVRPSSSTGSVVTNIKLRNPSQRRLCFKIKTTSPKRFTVKPNSGVLEPSDGVQIVVRLWQPFKTDQTTKHQFMVQSTFAPEGEINQDTIWSEIHQNDVMASKLRCVFVRLDAQEDFEASEVEESQLSSDLEEEGSSQRSRGEGEIGELTKQLTQLRQENVQLKDEIQRMKQPTSATKKFFFSSSTTIRPWAEVVMRWRQIYVAIIILVFGLMLGKFFF